MSSDSDLCVGGPIAGQRYAAIGEVFRVPVREEPATLAVEPGNVTKLAPRDVVYRRQAFRTPEGIVTLWAPADQSGLATLRMLLEAYEERNKP